MAIRPSAKTIVDDFIYVADTDGGLQIVNISDPTHLYEEGHFYTEGWAYDVAVSSNYAYIAAMYEGLQILDISNPNHIFEVGFYDAVPMPFGVTVYDDYVYLADGYWGLRVIDVSRPSDPIEVGYYQDCGSAFDVAIFGDNIYLAKEHFVSIYNSDYLVSIENDTKDSVPRISILHPPYPNPFNSASLLSLALPQSSMVELNVYDISGRVVSKLLNAWRTAGTHQIIFDASLLTSGIYIARIKAGEYTAQQKLVYLK